MRYAIARFEHPQDRHQELLIQDAAGKIRRWACAASPLAPGVALEERPADSEDVPHYLYDGGGQFRDLKGYWSRVEGGACELIEQSAARVVVRLAGGRVLELSHTGASWIAR